VEGHHEQNGDQERSEQAFHHGGGVVEGGESAGRCGGLRGGVTARVKHRMMSFAHQVLALSDGCKCSRPIASNLLVVGKMFPRPPLQSRRTRSWRGIGVGLCATRTSAKRNNGPGRAHLRKDNWWSPAIFVSGLPTTYMSTHIVVVNAGRCC
jgi:hypothetical protein